MAAGNARAKNEGDGADAESFGFSGEVAIPARASTVAAKPGGSNLMSVRKPRRLVYRRGVTAAAGHNIIVVPPDGRSLRHGFHAGID